MISKQERADSFSNLPMTEVEDPTEGHAMVGNLLIQTLFVPSLRTKNNLQIYEDFNAFPSPEAYRHYSLLLKHQMFDSYHYTVPTSQYTVEKHLESKEAVSNVVKLVSGLNKIGRPRVLANSDRLSRELVDIQKRFDKLKSKLERNRVEELNNIFRECVRKKLFTCPEEILDFLMWLGQMNRPSRQEFSESFENMWIANRVMINNDQSRKYNRFFWQSFLNDLIKNGEGLNIDRNMSFQPGFLIGLQDGGSFVENTLE